MLSRLHPRAGTPNLLKCIGQFQVPAASAGSSSLPQKESPKRDLINFPRPQRLEKSPDVVFGFLPKYWFDFMYPKTGVTGPYMLLTGISTYVISKEILVFNPETYLGISFVLLVTFLHKKFGPTILELTTKIAEENEKAVSEEQNLQKEEVRDSIKNIETSVYQAEGIGAFLPNAKRENVYLQMEAEYRQRLNEVHEKTKKLLDYQIEKSVIERRMSQKCMVDWIVRNVEKSVSPQLKKNALKQCIGDLKNLSLKA